MSTILEDTLLEDGGRKKQWTRAEVFQNSDFPFGIRRAYPQTPHVLHSHQRFTELVAVYRGEGIHYLEEAEYRVTPGDVFVINGKLRHGYKDVHDLHLVNIMFDPRHFLGETDHVKKLPGYHVLFSLEPKFRHKHQFESRLRLSPDQLDRLLTFVDDLESELENHEPGYEYMVTATFMLVVGYLCRCYAGSSHPASRSLIRIGEVISFLERHYEEPITLDHLQEIVGMSSSVLLRTFRDATGYSPIEYLIRLRIARSCKLLRNSDMAVTETAFRVGFSDSNYFARQFKRVMGTSPTSYRKKAHVL